MGCVIRPAHAIRRVKILHLGCVLLATTFERHEHVDQRLTSVVEVERTHRKEVKN